MPKLVPRLDNLTLCVVMSLFGGRRFLSSLVQTSIIETSHNTNNTLSFEDITRLYYRLVQRCIENKSLTDTKLVHGRVLKLGLVGLNIGNKLTDGYLKCGSIVDARKVFEELPQRAIITWNSLISRYVSLRKCKEAISLYSRMVSEGVLPDRFTFLSVFKALSELNRLKEAKKAHGMSVVLGLEISDVFVGSSIVDMYAKFGKMREAESVVDRVFNKDVVLYTALIVGYTQRGDSEKALKSFGKMVDNGIKANEFTFASILISCGNLEDSNLGRLVHGFIVKSGFESVVASQTSLLTMYARCGLVDDSSKIFEDFSFPNQVTWTSFIVALVQNSREEFALTKFKEMIRGSTIPNSFTLSGIIQACSRLALVQGGTQIHGLAVKFGLDSDRYSGATLVDFYGKCGSTEMALSVFENLVKTDLASTNSMIYSYAQSGFGREAIELFGKMKTLGLEPNEVTIMSVLLACNNAGLVEEGCEIFDSIRNDEDRNSVLTRDHYACMVNLLGRCGRLEEAETLVKEVKNPDVVLFRTLLGACKIHGEVEMAERTLSRLRELSPEDGATHVLMSNLYASTSNWTKVAEMKSSMRTMKMKKERAVSWVEIDKEVHTFMAGDWSHPRSKEINEMLDNLLEKVTDLGYVPDTRFALQNVEEDDKKSSLYYHSEKLAIAFALWVTRDRTSLPIRIFKNLRVCGDCHSWIKLVSKVVGREVVARDAKRFHHFKDGSCSCKDYW